MNTPAPSVALDRHSGPAADAAASHTAAEVLLRLNRAVQRAMIYPPEHPVVRQAIAPFAEVTAVMLAETPRFVLFVSRHTLLIVRGEVAPESLTLPWLSSRLSDRGLASITITDALGEASAAGLVAWLARPAQEDDAPPRLPGVQFSWRSYAHARFTEHVTGAAVASDAGVLWQGMVHGLAADWLDLEGNEASHGDFDIDQLADDPVALAKFARNTLLTQEGMGVSAIANRIVSFGGRLGELSEAGRAVVRQKLAQFIAELAPELRGQLLRILPGDSPEKIATLSEVVDELPRTLVLEVLQGIDLEPGGQPSSFITLMTKMVHLSIGDSDMQQALGRTFKRAGLPDDILNKQEDQLRTALERIFTTPIDRESMSAEYREQLDALLARRVEPMAYDGSHLYSPMRADHLSVEVPRIAIAVLSACPLGSDAAILLERARAAGPAMLAADDLDSLALLANVACSVSSSAAASSEEVQSARTTLAFLAQPAVVELFMKHVDDPYATLPLAAGELFKSGGLPVVSAALDRLVSSASPVVHSRVIGLLAQLDAAVLKVALTQARTQGRITSRVVLGLLCHQEIGHVVEIADLFSYDEDPELRLQAYKVIFAESQASRTERALRRALEDRNHHVVELAVNEVSARQEPSGVRALGQLLSRLGDGSLERAQKRGIAMLAQLGTPAAREALSTALAGRGRAFDRTSRRVSLQIVRALEASRDDASIAAAAAWRWSPAGLVSLVLRERAVA
ncbi:MAG: hypothetical protein AB7I50_09800 [Vicinamibacterales bacterium]